MKWIPLACTLTLTLAATYAHGDCQQKLADVDKQLASANLEGMTQQQYAIIREQAAMLCNQGQEAMAMQFLSGIEQELTGSQGAQQSSSPGASSPTGPKISDDYLAGTWCAIVTQEQTEITFNRDGTYSACFHDSMQGRFGHCTRPRSTEQWFSSFKQARIVTDDEFALGNSTRSSTYRRGNCSEHGI